MPSVVIEIRDTGPGIPREIRDKIFDPFFTTKDVGKGTGQGLAIARSIVVDKHGGSIGVACPPDGGAVFTIRLPMPDEPDSLSASEDMHDGGVVASHDAGFVA
jgi:signal transduction histidine kinase